MNAPSRSAMLEKILHYNGSEKDFLDIIDFVRENRLDEDKELLIRFLGSENRYMDYFNDRSFFIPSMSERIKIISRLTIALAITRRDFITPQQPPMLDEHLDDKAQQVILRNFGLKL